MITVLSLTAHPAVADRRPSDTPATPPGSQPPPPGMIQALRRDLGLSQEQAEARLLNEVRLAPIEARLRGELGNRFAGSWLSGTIAQTLVVATTSAADIPSILAAGARPEVVVRSLAQLTPIKQKLDQALPARPRAGNVRYIDVRNNIVVVLSAAPKQAETIIDAVGVDKASVSVVPSSEPPRLLGDVRGGDAYYIGAANRCSVGFAVTRGARRGFVTAGHCGERGAATSGADLTPQGVFQGSAFPGGDHAWIAVNPRWTLTPTVSNGGTGAAGAVPVVGARVAIEGASVCRSGSTTGWRCGLVQQRDASVTYPQGTVFGLTRTNVCGEPGDSGGSFISIDQAQGVTSGGSGDCSLGGTTYFQPVNEILSAYRLILLTTARTP
ncbi:MULTISPECIES: S1 family peptidase [unclassified Streptosporangium]|uniref:S1 family peptidase n=1 Tax=unclassified Streptosporangium TaxID=2632669 RepID=UPI002E284B39|nr:MULTISPECIES: S1 family peptidase [unclassified Streptosporangium]